MKILYYFLLGMLLIGYIFPVLDSLSSWLLLWIEKKKGKLSVEVAKYNSELENITTPTETHAIGFQVPPVEYEEEEDDDDF